MNKLGQTFVTNYLLYIISSKMSLTIRDAILSNIVNNFFRYFNIIV